MVHFTAPPFLLGLILRGSFALQQRVKSLGISSYLNSGPQTIPKATQPGICPKTRAQPPRPPWIVRGGQEGGGSQVLLILPSDTEMRMERPTVGKVKEGSVPGPVAGAPAERPTCPTSNEGGRQRREEKTSVPSPPLEALRERETADREGQTPRRGGGARVLLLRFGMGWGHRVEVTGKGAMPQVQL